MNSINEEIIKECEREEENCLYTSTTLYLWLTSIRRLKAFFIIVPLLLGGFTGVEVLTESHSDSIKYIIGISALLAGILPSIYSALKIDSKIELLDKTAGKYKILQGKFRRLRLISSKGNSFEEEFSLTIKELENLKANSITTPQRFFKKAQNKISGGDYDFTADETESRSRE